jgi:hypothetical protein
VLQSFVPGTNLIVHGARSAISGEVAQAAFDVSEMLDGVSLVVRCTTIDAGTLAACAEFVRRAEIEGVYHFEFRKNSDGQLFFLDFNGRLGGTTGKVLRLGYDEPALLVQCFTQRSLTLDRCDDSAMASNRMAIAKAALRSLRARMTIFDYPLQSPGRRIAGLMSGLFRWRDEILHFGELRSGLAFMLSQLADRFRR